jgi:excisionase family DNA binding protein
MVEEVEKVEVPQKRQHKPLVNPQVLDMRAKGWITAREAAKLGGISVPRVYALINDGKLTGCRKGTRRYVSRASVEAHFAEKTDEQAAS